MSYTRPPVFPHRQTIDTTDGDPYLSPATISVGVLDGANISYYIPALVHVPVILRKLYYACGSTATGNIDIGVYNAAGSLLISTGSTAKSSTSAIVFIDVTDTTLAPGRYWLALATDSATDTFPRLVPAAPQAVTFGVLTEATFPLPATATMVVNQTVATIPVVGMSLVTVLS